MQNSCRHENSNEPTSMNHFQRSPDHDAAQNINCDGKWLLTFSSWWRLQPKPETEYWEVNFYISTDLSWLSRVYSQILWLPCQPGISREFPKGRRVVVGSLTAWRRSACYSQLFYSLRLIFTLLSVTSLWTFFYIFLFPRKWILMI